MKRNNWLEKMILAYYEKALSRKPIYAEARNTIFSRIDRGQLVRIISNNLVPTDISDNILR